MVDEPERRREIDQGLQDVYRDMAIAPAACSIKSALELIGIKAGRPRLPYVPLDASSFRSSARCSSATAYWSPRRDPVHAGTAPPSAGPATDGDSR